MTKKNLLEKREIAIKEYRELDKNTNLKLEENNVEIDFLEEITETESIKELNEVRFNMFQIYSYSVHEIVEEILDSFSLVDTKKENEEFMNLGIKLENLEKENPSENDILELKKIFKDIFNFYKKIQKNEKNLIRQEQKEFYGEILPKWTVISSGAWVAITGIFIFGMGLKFNFVNATVMILGWIIILLLTYMILKIKLYKTPKKTKPPKKSS